MSERARPRRTGLIAGVLLIGLLVNACEILADRWWSDWEAGILTPMTLQVYFLAGVIDTIVHPVWEGAATFVLIGLLVYGCFAALALVPLLVPDSTRQLWAKIMLILLFLASAIGWWSNWPLLQWGPYNRWRTPLACAGAALAGLSLIAFAFWRRNPDGRAAFWYPATLQVWVQSLWIPWPDVD